jgi:hypothetical protein
MKSILLYMTKKVKNSMMKVKVSFSLILDGEFDEDDELDDEEFDDEDDDDDEEDEKPQRGKKQRRD